MIDRQHLAEALARLDPRDREVLYLSLRRRVPDEDLAEFFECSPGDVARMRATAIERLSYEMGVERGSDLGHMLKELLDPATWQVKPAAEDTLRASGEGHRPVGAIGPVEVAPAHAQVAAAAEHEAGPERTPDAKRRPGPERAPDAEREAGPERAPDAEREAGAERAPVLGILEERPDAGRADSPPPTRGQSRARRVAVGVAVALALFVPAAVVTALTSGQSDPRGAAAEGASGARPFQPDPQVLGEPFPSDPKAAGQYPVARIERKAVLYREPRGKAGTRIGPKTEFDSPRVLSVVEQRDGWLAVLAPELDNGEVGWIREGAVKRLGSVSFSLHIDLSERTLVVRRNDEPVRRVKVGVGRSTNPTPRGRYAVTDKLRVSDPESPYGCCVLALTGHQEKLPEGWPGGDRLAVHATRDTSGLGQAVSLGCLRSDPKDARWMIDTVPLGTPVFVKA